MRDSIYIVGGLFIGAAVFIVLGVFFLFTANVVAGGIFTVLSLTFYIILKTMLICD